MSTGTNYAAGVFLDGKICGDPAIDPIFRKAKPGDLVQLCATGLVSTESGTVPRTQTYEGVSVRVGDIIIPAQGDCSGLCGRIPDQLHGPTEFRNLAGRKLSNSHTILVRSRNSVLASGHQFDADRTRRPSGPALINLARAARTDNVTHQADFLLGFLRLADKRPRGSNLGRIVWPSI